jgi:hypothetical protein
VDRFGAPARTFQPVPIRALENFGRTSAPRLPHAVQTKSGSMSDSRTSSAQPSALIAIGNDVVLFGAVGYKLERVIGGADAATPWLHFTAPIPTLRSSWVVRMTGMASCDLADHCRADGGSGGGGD